MTVRSATLALLLAVAGPATAQSLPSWAESPSAAAEGPVVLDGPTADAVPAPPAAPTQVPVDGGLVVLGAAGAAYAVRRFRRV